MLSVGMVLAASAGLMFPVADGDLASMSCIYDGMTPAERDAFQGPELRDPGISEAAHDAVRAKVQELGRACVEKWRWDQQDIEAAAVYMSVRSGYETSRRQIVARGVRESVIDTVIARLTPEQRSRIRKGAMDRELGVTIVEIALEDATFRRAMEDEKKSPSAARLLGRAIGGKLFMDAASKGELSLDDLRKFVERVRQN